MLLCGGQAPLHSPAFGIPEYQLHEPLRGEGQGIALGGSGLNLWCASQAQVMGYKHISSVPCEGILHPALQCSHPGRAALLSGTVTSHCWRQGTSLDGWKLEVFTAAPPVANTFLGPSDLPTHGKYIDLADRLRSYHSVLYR